MVNKLYNIVVLVVDNVNSFRRSTHRIFPLIVFLFARLAVAHKVVERSVLNQSGENKDEAH